MLNKSIQNICGIFIATHSLTLIGVLIFVTTIIAGVNRLHSAEGVINSVSYNPVPNGATVVIEPFDDSDDSLSIAKALKTAIKTAGYTPSDTGSLLMIFEVRNDLGAFSTRNRRYILSIKTAGGRLGGGQESLAQVNLFNSNTGGLLNKGRGTTTITTPSTYQINVTIENRISGNTLWQGWVTTELQNYGGIEHAPRMIPKIVEAIGKTIRQENFSLY